MKQGRPRAPGDKFKAAKNGNLEYMKLLKKIMNYCNLDSTNFANAAAYGNMEK